MTEYERIMEQIRVQTLERAEKWREHIATIDAELAYLNKRKLEVCDHTDIRSHVYSYEEAPRIRYHEWNQWVCEICGKEISDEEYDNIVATQQGSYSI